RRAQMQQRLTVASTHYLTAHCLPRAVQAFRAANPAVCLFLRPRSWPEVVRMIERGHADVGILPHFADAPRSPSLDFENLFELRFTLLTAPRHPLTKLKRIAAADLVKHPLILERDHGHLDAEFSINDTMLERVFRRNDLLDRMQVVLETPLVDII